MERRQDAYVRLRTAAVEAAIEAIAVNRTADSGSDYYATLSTFSVPTRATASDLRVAQQAVWDTLQRSKIGRSMSAPQQRKSIVEWAALAVRGNRPTKKAAAKKTATKKTAAKKTAAKKTATKTVPAKPTGKKAPSKQAPAKKQPPEVKKKTPKKPQPKPPKTPKTPKKGRTTSPGPAAKHPRGK